MIVTCHKCGKAHSLAPDCGASAFCCLECGTDMPITIEMLEREVLRYARLYRDVLMGEAFDADLALERLCDLVQATQGLEMLEEDRAHSRAVEVEVDGPDGPSGYTNMGALIDPGSVCRCGSLLNGHPVAGCALNGGCGSPVQPKRLDVS
jgi:hypothetical protein